MALTFFGRGIADTILPSVRLTRNKRFGVVLVPAPSEATHTVFVLVRDIEIPSGSRFTVLSALILPVTAVKLVVNKLRRTSELSLMRNSVFTT